MFANMAGIKIVTPSNAYDAKVLMIAAKKDVRVDAPGCPILDAVKKMKEK